MNTDALPGKPADIMKVRDGNGNFVSYRLVCANNVFHLGVLNGDGNLDALYGYFSEFRLIEPGIKVTNNKGIVDAGGHIPICRGESIELDANIWLYGVRYEWSPAKYLDATDKPKVKVINPKQTTAYTVTVSRYCDFHPRSTITVEVHPDMAPYISGPSVLCGTGEVPIDFTELGGAKKLNMVLEE